MGCCCRGWKVVGGCCCRSRGILVGCGWALLVGVFVVGGFCGRRLRVLVVGRVCRWWGLVMGARPRLRCLGVSLRSPLAGDGGCSCSPSPSFVSPGCTLPFAVGGGCSPRSCRLVGCSCPLFAGDGDGCSCSPSFMSPRCELPLVVGARTRSRRLVRCSCPPLVGDGGGHSPPFVPRCVLTPVRVACCVAPLLRVVVVVCWWGLVSCVWDERAHH